MPPATCTAMSDAISGFLPIMIAIHPTNVPQVDGSFNRAGMKVRMRVIIVDSLNKTKYVGVGW